MIHLQNVCKTYASKKVLTNVNIVFETGKTYGIVGENGCGKTTLFHCIAGLEKYNGSIETSPSPLKNTLGLLLAEPFFFQNMTGREYIQLLCNARGKKAENVNAKNIFDLPLDAYISTYSTGMKKKIAFTAMLLQDNTHFILDEPFNGVDIPGNTLILAVLQQLKSLGKTILISSHIFSTLKESCDEILLLQNGNFTKKANPSGFDDMEKEIKHMLIGSKLDNLDLK